MNVYQQFIHKSRYARWNSALGRREHWDETVERYIEYIVNHCKKNLTPLKEEDVKDLRKYIIDLEIMPSMRSLMSAGKALELDQVAGFNCLAGDTLVTTKEYGILPIRDVVGKSVHIVDGNGEWVLSECKSYGTQNLFSVNLSTSGIGEDFSIKATESHRWIMKDGSVKTTAELQKDESLSSVKFPERIAVNINSHDYREGIKHGLIYGDGTAQYKNSKGSQLDSLEVKKLCKGFVIRLCSDVEDLIPYFDGHPCSFPKSFNGNPVVYLFDNAAIDLKSLPDTSIDFYSNDYLTGFMRGWLASDGSVTKSGQVTLASTEDGIKWIYENSTKTGIIPRTHRRFPEKTNLGQRKNDLFSIEFDRRWLVKEDFIIKRKQDRFNQINTDKNIGFGKIKSITDLKVSEEVYCFEVPTTQSFLLTKNILTGNCSFLPINSPRCFDELMYILMCGTGVGYSVENKFVNNLPYIAEEFHETETTIIVSDSKIGWASSFRELISLLYAGKIPNIDISKVRPKGARLKTFGGRSSGPQPLLDLFKFTINLFKKSAGRKLSTLECHDLVCKIADIVVVGGVRRCLLGTDDVVTNLGVRKLREISVGDLVATDEGFKKVLEKECVGERQLLRITTNLGTLFSTPEHRWAVATDSLGSVEWIEARNLNSTHRLLHNSTLIEGEYLDFPEDHDLATLPKLNIGSSWFVGYFLGNGSCSIRKRPSGRDTKFRVCYPTNFPELESKTIDQFNKILNSFYLPRKIPNKSAAEIICSKVGYAEYGLKHLKQPNQAISIPPFIKENSLEIRASFVAGVLDSDGSVRNRLTEDKSKGTGIFTAVSTKYESFARELQSLIASFGIPTVLKCKKREGKSDEWVLKSINTKYTRQLYELLLPYSVKLQYDYVLNENNSKDTSGLSLTRNLIPKEFRQGCNPEVGIHLYESLVGNLDIIPISIIDITEDSIQTVYDIQVEEDECFYVNGVLTHNSALISLSDLSDDRLRDAKSGQWWLENVQRALANNSAVYEERPDIGKFMEEWNALYKSQSGERGLFNRQAALKHSDNGRRDLTELEGVAGVNPCQPSFAPILTKEGLRTFADIDIDDYIWSSEGWTKIVNKWSTGIKPVYAYKTNAGIFYGTENHRIVSNGEKIEVGLSESIDVLRGIRLVNKSLDSLEVKQAILDGLLIGDGSVHLDSKDKIYLNIGVKDQDYFTSEVKELILGKHSCKKDTAYKVQTTLNTSDLPHTYLRQVPERYLQANSDIVCGFLRGLYSANGSICGNRVTLKATSKILVEQVQLMLNSVGIKSYITKNKSKKVEFTNGTYLCKESFDINITEDRNIFYETIGFIQKYKEENLKTLVNNLGVGIYKNTYDIISVDYLGDMEVFDITVDNDSHTYWTGGLNVSNCGEIILRPFEFCNLSEVVIRPEDNLKTLTTKVRLATILGTIQSSFTDFRYLRKIWKKNCDEERLLGVSLTGIMDNSLTSSVSDTLKNTLNKLRETAISTNKEYAEYFNIPVSAAITCIKPSGTVSQLVGSSSGIHPSFSPYYIRTVRSDIKDPIATFMANIGIPVEPDVTKPNDNLVFSFPCKSSETSVCRDNISAIEQLELYKVYRECWTEHNPSITVYVREEEWLKVGAWVYENFSIVGGISFLPFSDHVYKQAPYQPISKEEYDELYSKFPSFINWDDLANFEKEDTTTGTQELSCSAGVCEI